MVVDALLLDGFGRVKDVVHGAIHGLDEAALSFRPADDTNTIAWLIWHLTRIQDDHLAGLRQAKQVWEVGGWYQKFGLPFSKSDTGYGHDASQVASVKASAELLGSYYDAVHAETEKFIKSLPPADYEKIVDERWDPPVTMAVRLVSVLSDDLQHAGQAAYVRGLLPQ